MFQTTQAIINVLQGILLGAICAIVLKLGRLIQQRYLITLDNEVDINPSSRQNTIDKSNLQLEDNVQPGQVVTFSPKLIIVSEFRSHNESFSKSKASKIKAQKIDQRDHNSSDSDEETGQQDQNDNQKKMQSPNRKTGNFEIIDVEQH